MDVSTRGWENLGNIDLYLGNSTRQARTYYGTLTRNQEVADRSVCVPVTLSDLERRDARGQSFGDHNYARTV